jgi:GT2 family glycosyltransferase
MYTPPAQPALPTLDVIIVNWNAGRQLRECLAALREARTSRIRIGRVVVVDNASSDGSAAGGDVEGLPLVVQRNATNRGFAAACNQGARSSAADYLLFLNPDTRVSSDALDRTAALMGSPGHSRTGICGVQMVDAAGQVSRSSARLPTPRLLLAHSVGLDRLFPRHFPGHVMSEWDHADSREVDHVIGAFYFVRRSLFEQLAGFDERFFVYLEDLDFSARARQLGYRSWYLADAQVYHRGGGTSEQIKGRRLFYAIRSRILYAYKHFDRVSATGLMLVALVVEPLVRTGFAVLQRAGRQVLHTAEAYALLWRHAPDILRTAMRG